MHGFLDLRDVLVADLVGVGVALADDVAHVVEMGFVIRAAFAEWIEEIVETLGQALLQATQPMVPALQRSQMSSCSSGVKTAWYLLTTQMSG